jgi:hypothetical protein
MIDPTALYRPGSEPNPDVYGRLVEVGVFAAADVPAALEGGWFRKPWDVPDRVEPLSAELEILDGNAVSIAELLPAMTKAELESLLIAETNGKTRKGVVAAIEKAITEAEEA